MILKAISFCCILIFCSSSIAFSGEHVGTFCWIDNQGDYLELAVSSTGLDNVFSAAGTSYDNLSNPPVIGSFIIKAGTVDGILSISGKKEGNVHFDTVGSLILDPTTLSGSWLATSRLFNPETGQVQLGGKSLEFSTLPCDQIPR